MIKILVTEDEALSRMMLMDMLRRILGEDAMIECAANGRQAVELAEKIDPHLIFMDIEMPVMNGLEAAEVIQHRVKTAKIVFLTAYDRFDYAVGALRAGASDYLLKPFDWLQLEACLKKTLGLSLEKSDGQPERDSLFHAQFSVWLGHHYQQDVSLEQAASSLGMSAFYFSRLMRATYNQTFLEYLTDYRIERAISMLRATVIPVREIAQRVGYTDANYFTKVFKRHEGMTPTEYRQKMVVKDAQK